MNSSADLPTSTKKNVVKIIVLGSSNVGKSAIIQRYCHGKYTDKRRVTVGADYMTKKIKIMDCDIILQIWDTAGQERFHQGSIGSAFYRGSDGALLVYDMCNEKSFDQITHWRDEATNRIDQDAYFPIVVVGNKLDLQDTDMIVDQIEVKEWCKDNGYGHTEVSAKEDIGIQVAMEAIAALALEAQKQNALEKRTNITKQPSIRIDELYSPSHSGLCGGGC
mmetsp:Transcript_16140/g.16273  ORF Transcript_16140/g.16273 Transcript_16140/m.16273 type:complete len:221 (+) Transcript_16140:271-933(+)|eukprot:CAMPEP_0182439634 /NCGR_PEP_ID=MMETSP1167-20130531/86556_1 /TAXON_ID=2988 /ORGANISM="Mallomonas Sp, Strain CCMP3275" /LENGTH=220 /DNA_ID=CAMNT_0024633377 /DNA_START=245 /DNA_END=907 /DNA_ORIENTATION=+